MESFRFPKGVYGDVRIETLYKTVIQRVDGRLSDVRRRTRQGAFVRLFDGKRWYMSGFDNVDQVQGELDALASIMASESAWADTKDLEAFIHHIPIVTGQVLLKSDCPVFSVSLKEKERVVEKAGETLIASRHLAQHEVFYTDFVLEKQMINSLGGRVGYQKEGAGLWASAAFTEGRRSFRDRYVYSGISFDDLVHKAHRLEETVRSSACWLLEGEPVAPGSYEVILSPEAAGLFAHESVGHLSEADFGTPTKGQSLLSSDSSTLLSTSPLTIVDDGNLPGWGYTPYDDEGMPAKRTVLVQGGQRSQKMHSLETSWRCGEAPTGNARAIDHSFEPMVRMTNTVILPGSNTLEEMKASVSEGLLVENVAGGFGMDNFTLTPLRCWKIQQGKVTGPATASVITGQVENVLRGVSMVGCEGTQHAMVKGGCGKMDQFPLDVGFGGPPIKVDRLEVW